MKNFKEYFLLFIKGMGMGAANVIPGVSGGTIALITGIFERLIDSIKSFDLTAVQLLFKFRLKEFFRHTDFFFLTAVLGGAVVSVFSLAKLLEFLFANYPIFVWSFFFGLILASVYFVGKTVEKWTLSVIITF
jgi:putative membrane protein